MKQDDPIIKELQDAVETTALFEVEAVLNKYGGELIKKAEGNYIGYIRFIQCRRVTMTSKPHYIL